MVWFPRLPSSWNSPSVVDLQGNIKESLRCQVHLLAKDIILLFVGPRAASPHSVKGERSRL